MHIFPTSYRYLAESAAQPSIYCNTNGHIYMASAAIESQADTVGTPLSWAGVQLIGAMCLAFKRWAH